jgi:hypothetical protein
VEEICWELALGRLARVILTEMEGEREVASFPISLQNRKRQPVIAEPCIFVVYNSRYTKKQQIMNYDKL